MEEKTAFITQQNRLGPSWKSVWSGSTLEPALVETMVQCPELGTNSQFLESGIESVFI